jgi:hypothetical protein
MQTSLLDPSLRKHLEQIGFVTRNYNDLRGRLTAWVGLGCLFWGLCNGLFIDQLESATNRGATDAWNYILLPLAAAVIGLSFAFGPGIGLLMRYYQYVFGVVVQPKAWRCPTFLFLLLLFFPAFSRFLPGGVVVYAAFGVAWVAQGLARPQIDRLILGFSVLALGACQRYLTLPPGVSSADLGFLVCGAACIVVGLLDHRRLVSVLGPPALSHRGYFGTVASSAALARDRAEEQP